MSEEIANEMHRLEIASTSDVDNQQLRTIDFIDLPLNLNPFYEDETILNDLKCEDVQVENAAAPMQRYQQGCRRCRLRRRSESVADAYKSATMALNTVPSDVNCWTHSTLGIHRQSIKHRRNVLRPPVLRKLQNLQKLLQVLPVKTENEAPTAVTQSNATLTRSNLVPCKTNHRGICDFRDLIHECQSLLDMENDVKGRFGLVSPDQRISKNFTTIQLSKSPRSLFSTKQNDIFDITQSSPERNTGISSRSAATSTSCSQQAGNSADAVSNSGGSGDDVTIDELASYFDTFVHIPKKMSTMAEMMYI